MMKWVFSIMILFSVIIGFATGTIDKVSNAVLNTGIDTISLFFILLGSMAVWGGIMRIAEKSGITKKIAFLFSPIIKRLFKNLNPNGKAVSAITMNITANMLGLGNAATPLGIEAMKEMEKEENIKDTASRNMVVFTVLNTASIQLLPTTIASLRLLHGSKSPMEILPAILIVSACALTVGLILAFLLDNNKSR